MDGFIIVGNMNCITYKEVFPLIKDRIISIGSPVKEYKDTDRKFGNHKWMTTFPVPYLKGLTLTATYDPEKYKRYDNYDAIEVSRVENIPCDYNGIMGVPISFMDKFCPTQFEILGHEHDIDGKGTSICMVDNRFGNQFVINGGKGVYKRLLIRKRTEKEVEE